jgi:hypothetical protein
VLFCATVGSAIATKVGGALITATGNLAEYAPSALTTDMYIVRTLSNGALPTPTEIVAAIEVALVYVVVGESVCSTPVLSK